MELTQEQFDALKRTEAAYVTVLAEKQEAEKAAVKADELKKLIDAIMEKIAPKLVIPEAKFVVEDNVSKLDFNGKKMCFGEWMLAVRSGDPLIKTAMSTTSAQGGYTIPTGWYPEIVNLLNDVSTLYPKFRKVPMTVSSLALNSLLTSVTVAWATEAGTKTTTKPTFSQDSLTLKYIYAIITATKEFTEDTALTLDSFLKELVALAIGNEIEQEMLEGNASPFTGLLYATGVNALAQAGPSLVYKDLTGVVNHASVLEFYKKNAEWILNRTGLDAIMNLVDGNNRPLWNLNNPLAKIESTILGYPYNMSSNVATTAGATSAYFGPINTLWLGHKAVGEEMSVLYSETAVINVSTSVTENMFTENKAGWRFEKRPAILPAIPAAFVRFTGLKG